MSEVFEFRGVDNLVYADIITDSETEGYITGPVKLLAPVAEIGKTTETSSESKYYDNKAMITINSEGADTFTFTIPVLGLETLADITGKSYDSDKGMYVDGEITPTYKAVGYRTKGTDGKYRYVWRLKGSFAIPDETAATEDASTTTNNQQLTFTGISTAHKFTHGKKVEGTWTSAGAKGIVVDERAVHGNFATFFASVQTPDSTGWTDITKTATPVAHPTSSVFTGANLSVALTCDTPFADIYYTLDGTDPTTQSTPYDGGITITDTTTIKAVAFATGKTISYVMTKSYTKVEA